MLEIKERVLIIPDLHQHVGRAISAIEKSPEFDYIVFLGDYFDCFEEPDNKCTYSVAKTCEWLSSIKKEYEEKAIFLVGNHDLSYMESFNSNSNFIKNKQLYHTCSGFTRNKAKLINKYLDKSFFDGLRLCVKLHSFIAVHAGFTYYHFKPFFDELENIKELSEQWDKNKWNIKYDRKFKFSEPGMDNGGDFGIGSPLWVRWWHIQPLDTVDLIVGHTPVENARFKKGVDDKIVCNIDTHVRCFAYLNSTGDLKIYDN